MTRAKYFVLSLTVALAFFAAANPARAQGTTAPITLSKPAETPNAKTRKAEFQVLHMMSNAIQVQSLANLREIHTFTYSDGIRGKMQNVLDQGGYRYGDKVKIVYQPGSEIALRIKGKPSKPKTL